MFEADLKQVLLLKKAIKALRDLFPLTLWHISREGIEIVSTNLTNACIVRFNLGIDVFDRFRCDRPFRIGVDLQEFNKIMKCVTNEDIVSLQCKEMFAKELTVYVEEISKDGMNDTQGRSDKDKEITEYKCRLKSFDFDISDVKSGSNEAVIKMSSAKLQRICRDLSVITDNVTIACKPSEECVLFFVRGESGSGCAHVFSSLFGEDPNRQTTIKVNEPISLTFRLSHLIQICKASSVAPQVVLRLSKGGLLELEYNVKSDSSENSTIAGLYFAIAETHEE